MAFIWTFLRGIWPGVEPSLLDTNICSIYHRERDGYERIRPHRRQICPEPRQRDAVPLVDQPVQGVFTCLPFCYARSTHWFLDEDGVDGWSSKIFVKANATEVLRRELARTGWKREEGALGTATDPYQT